MKKQLSRWRPEKPLLKYNIKMKLTTLFLITTFFGLHANDSYAQKIKVTLKIENNTTVRDIIDTIESATEFRFIYKTKHVDLDQKLSLNVKDEQIEHVLNLIFENTKTAYKLRGKQIILRQRKEASPRMVFLKENSNDRPQDRVINGTINDESGSPLPGANILEKGTTNGTQSDFDGNFSISIADENATLEISYIGFATKEIVLNGQTDLNITLEESTAGLDEVIVVGFGVKSSRKVTAAIAQVSAEELGIEERPVTNIQSALVGSLPGVRGFNANGSPGATPNISIRGVSTFRGNGNNNNANALVIIDDFEGSLSDINPQDIETISVLKDAAAVAIYGARGANGVILITTKRTQKGEKIAVSYNFSGSIQTPAKLPTTLRASELIAFENFAVTGDPTGGGDASAPYSTEVISLANSGFYPETQWPDEQYKSSAAQQTHNLTIQGGTEKIGFLMTAGHLNQDGLVVGPDNFRRMNLRLKIDADITNWLTIGTNTVITNRIRNRTPFSTGNDLQGSPLFPVQTTDGFFVDKGSPGTANPIAAANSGSFDKTTVDAVNSQLYAKVKLLKGLTIEERVSFTKVNTNQRNFNNVYDFVRLNFEDPDSYTNPDSANRTYVSGIPDARNLTLTSQTNYKVTALTRLNYDAVFGDHTLGVLLGFQSIQGQSEGFRAGRAGFFLDNPIDLTLGQNNRPVPSLNGSGADPLANTSFRGGNETTLSYFGRLNYDYKGKYIAEFSFRYDGSSRFLGSNRYGFFPSGSLAWNIDGENFMDNISFVDRLKLRASYGQTGDDAGIARSVKQFADLDNTGYPFGGEIRPGIFLGSPANPNLKWETATIFNAGFDFSLWQGKFQLNTEYFINNREDILDFAITPREFGFGNVPNNVYAAKSWGWEFELAHRNNIGADFSYWFNGNLAIYDNEITDLAGRQSPERAVGQSINKRLGFETDGFFDDQVEIDGYVQTDGTTPIDQSGVGGSSVGGFKFVDQLTEDTNGDGIPDTGNGVIDAEDRVILERNSADNMLVGFNIGATYKGLSLSARFYGSLDRTQWWSSAESHEPFLNGTNAYTYQLNYWATDNQNAFFPVPQGNGIQGYNSDISHFIFENDFIKLQNVTMSYKFGAEFLDRISFLNDLNLTLSVENIGTVWTNSPIRDSGWDPELGAGAVDYPLPITTSLGLNVRF